MKSNKSNDSKKDVTLEIGDNRLSLPRISGSLGPDVIDIRNLYKDSDFFTLS